MDIAGGLVLVVLVVLVLTYFARHHERARRARFLRRVGFGSMALFGGFFALFLTGETLADPGGWAGAGLVALWAVPLALACLLAWFRPDAARWLFPPVVALVIAFSIWFAVDPSGWRTFEDNNGPVRAILVFALAAALALWGLRRTMLAGVLLLVVGILPLAISSIGHGAMASLAAASSAPVLTGALYVAAAFLDRRQPPPLADAATKHPKAA